MVKYQKNKLAGNWVNEVSAQSSATETVDKEFAVCCSVVDGDSNNFESITAQQCNNFLITLALLLSSELGHWVNGELATKSRSPCILMLTTSP